jgi:hypothetical protein
LPEPQLRAVDRALVRADEGGPATEPRAVAAAFPSAVEQLAEMTPVLIVVDDAQWLDPSSVFALDYAARRFTGRIGVLATVRTGLDSGSAASWLHVRDGSDDFAVNDARYIVMEFHRRRVLPPASHPRRLCHPWGFQRPRKRRRRRRRRHRCQ